jgi:hypothetical protein
MNQTELERAVCRATGESKDVIRRVGFQLVRMPRIVLLPRAAPGQQARQNHYASAGK